MADEFDQMEGYEQVEDYLVQPLPGFAKGFIITDLVFCVLRSFIFLLGIIGFFFLKPKELSLVNGIIELFSNFSIALFGIGANILLLMKRKEGVPLAFICIFFTVINMMNGIWTLFLNPNASKSPAALIGMVIGGIFVFSIRTILVGLYIFAIKKAKEVIR